MLSPQVAQRIEKMLAYYEKGLFIDQEICFHLASLVSRDNAVDMIDAVPSELQPLLKEAVVAAARDAVDEECLAPEESVFDGNSMIGGYYLNVAQVLLERNAGGPRPHLSVVCLPSFEMEWALRVCGTAKIGFTAILTEAVEKIWGHPDPQSIQLRVSERAVDTELGETVFSIWKHVLMGTRHPRRGRFGLDGIAYHFACAYPDVGRLAGRTWSPEDNTIPGKLVAVSHALRSFVETSPEQSERMRETLDRSIAEIGRVIGGSWPRTDPPPK